MGVTLVPAYISRPRTSFGAHKISTDEIADDIRSHHHDHPRLNAILRVIGNCGVRTRYFARPLDSPTVSGVSDVGERARTTFDDALDLAEQAAGAALAEGASAQGTSTPSSPPIRPGGPFPIWTSS